MNTLMEFVSQISFKQTTNGQQQKQNATLPWLDISSLIFGTYMVHRVINEQAKEDYKFGQNPWFESFLFNFGEVCDRIKLFALLQDNGYSIFQQYLYLLVIRSPSRMAISRSYPSHFFNFCEKEHFDCYFSFYKNAFILLHLVICPCRVIRSGAQRR